jgi:hypothetical protein
MTELLSRGLDQNACKSRAEYWEMRTMTNDQLMVQDQEHRVRRFYSDLMMFVGLLS